jgi:hypothetical protein
MRTDRIPASVTFLMFAIVLAAPIVTNIILSLKLG